MKIKEIILCLTIIIYHVILSCVDSSFLSTEFLIFGLYLPLFLAFFFYNLQFKSLRLKKLLINNAILLLVVLVSMPCFLLSMLYINSVSYSYSVFFGASIYLSFGSMVFCLLGIATFALFRVIRRWIDKNKALNSKTVGDGRTLKVSTVLAFAFIPIYYAVMTLLCADFQIFGTRAREFLPNHLYPIVGMIVLLTIILFSYIVKALKSITENRE